MVLRHVGEIQIERFAKRVHALGARRAVLAAQPWVFISVRNALELVLFAKFVWPDHKEMER